MSRHLCRAQDWSGHSFDRAPGAGLGVQGKQGGAHQANRSSEGIGHNRSPDGKVQHLRNDNTRRAGKDRNDHNSCEHLHHFLLKFFHSGSGSLVAKVRQHFAQSKTYVTFLRRAAFALAVAGAIVPPAVAQVGAGQAAIGQGDPSLFLPGDICSSASSRAADSVLKLARDQRAKSDLVLAEYSTTQSDAPATGEAAAHEAGKTLPQLAAAGMADPMTPHADDPAMAAEHAALLALVPQDGASDVAIADGSWFAPETWASGKVPADGAKALIPAGITVTYDATSEAPLFSLRVDGMLTFASERDSRMIIDTLVIAPEGRLQIGTSAQPIAPEVQVEILIAGAGEIDTTWDPMLMSRGVVSHGEVEIHGARKTAFLKAGEPPKRGDQELVLASAPEGWRVGDRLVVTGTFKRGWAWDNGTRAVSHHASQDEIVTITALEGVRVSINRPLLYNHYAPRADLAAYVANVTRNIRFASLAGAETPVSQRGHVMFMHSDAVDVRYAAFDHLGRTDKSKDAFDLAALSTLAPTSNIKGRYSLHLHKTGLLNRETPAMVVGNSVFGSPGWGYVHHASHADFVDNVAFDVFGAAYAAEDGNETGIWLRNIAIRSRGFDWGDAAAKVGADRHDNGRTGDGFFFAGRLVEAAENVAANTTHGFVWMHRSAPADSVPQTLQYPEVAYGRPVLKPEDPPIQGFRDNEAFGTEVGLMVINKNPEQGHDVRSVLDGFLNWETKKGVDISYSGHYTLIDFDLIGTAGQEFFVPDTGVNIGTNAFDFALNGLRLERFPVGVRLEQDFTFPVTEAELSIALIDVEAADVPQLVLSRSQERCRLLTRADLAGPGIAAFPQPVAIRANEDLTLWMDKRDSLGRTARQKAGDPQTIYRWEVPDLLRSTGYFTTADGQTIALIPEFLADRATGALMKHSALVTLNIPEPELQSWGVVHRGLYDPGKAPPVPMDDAVSTAVGQALVIAPLANDTAPDGGALLLDGLTDPSHGDLAIRPDGQLLYRPNLGFAGEDAFTYWATDGAGNFAPATVRITVLAP